MDVAITELEKIDATRVDGVDSPANGIPILLMKAVAPVVKGSRDCPKCDKSYDADHKGAKCENCGTDLPDGDASKAADDKVDCPTCKGDGKIMGDKRDCPDCEASGKVTPAKAKTLAAKALVKAIVGRKVDESPDIAGGTAVLAQIADLIIAEAQELKAGQAGEICDIQQLACAAEMIWCWRTGEESVASGSVMPATALMQSVKDAPDWTPEQWSAWQAELEKALSGAMGATVTAVFTKADMSTSSINDLPDSAFAYIEPGGSKDEGGKTTPRSLRHFPVHDAAHVRNALSRASQSPFGEKAMPKIKAAAKREGVDVSDDASKSEIATEVTSVDTVTKGSDDLDKAVADAVTKAVAPLEKLRAELEETLAKVKATPVHGGPVQSAAARPARQGESREEWAAKAAYYREMAATVTSDVRAAEGYRQLARQAEERAKAS